MIKLFWAKQIVAVYSDHYKVIFASKDDQKVREFGNKNRNELKKQGAFKVVTTRGLYIEDNGFIINRLTDQKFPI